MSSPQLILDLAQWIYAEHTAINQNIPDQCDQPVMNAMVSLYNDCLGSQSCTQSNITRSILNNPNRNYSDPLSFSGKCLEHGIALNIPQTPTQTVVVESITVSLSDRIVFVTSTASPSVPPPPSVSPTPDSVGISGTTIGLIVAGGLGLLIAGYFLRILKGRKVKEEEKNKKGSAPAAEGLTLANMDDAPFAGTIVQEKNAHRLNTKSGEVHEGIFSVFSRAGGSGSGPVVNHVELDDAPPPAYSAEKN
ncbi:UNVERIFIED_CONTAM: hypothetical protein HDU68_003812 [Siphonaria sp. JEL0065]|nr:hypothetical protein HDU68_003812 [Siphonaria sp. JEL0065]